jgi:hypothetical protein
VKVPSTAISDLYEELWLLHTVPGLGFYSLHAVSGLGFALFGAGRNNVPNITTLLIAYESDTNLVDQPFEDKRR